MCARIPSQRTVDIFRVGDDSLVLALICDHGYASAAYHHHAHPQIDETFDCGFFNHSFGQWRGYNPPIATTATLLFMQESSYGSRINSTYTPRIAATSAIRMDTL